MANIYVGSTKYSAVTAWAAGASVSVGDIRRQLATPTVGNERVWRCTTAGTTGGSEPSWTLTAGSTTNDNGIVWTEITGQAIYNGDGGGSAWAAPHARLSNAFASGWGAAGDTFYVSNNHAATQSTSLTLTNPGTAAALGIVLCVDDSVSPPTTLAATAQEITTGSTSISLVGAWYCHGLHFKAGSGAGTGFFSVGVGTTSFLGYFNSCAISLLNTGAANTITLPGLSPTRDNYSVWRNSSFYFGGSLQKFVITAGLLEMINCSYAPTGTVPTILFNMASNGALLVRDADLSTINTTLMLVSATSYGPADFHNCKLHASVTKTSGSFASPGGTQVRFHNCDSSGTNYNISESNYAATLTSETTIVNAAGASDGTTPLSWKVVSTSNCKFISPYRLPEIAKWNSVVGIPLTATIEITSNSTLKNDEVWVNIEYPSSSGSPQGAIATSSKADYLATAANITSSSATWGGSTTTKQKLQVTFTPQQAGPIKARIAVGKASLTVYIDPLLTLA